jgi:uncharacterized damage-inducible protein DinB
MPEVWLRGPLPGIPALLQPVAHALLQAKEEIDQLLGGFPEALLWERPAGVASVAFHLQHIVGVLDRLFTYANGQQLSSIQLTQLKAEGVSNPKCTKEILLHELQEKIDATIEQLSNIEESSLYEHRVVGRQQLPSTKMGLIFHAAEHTMRHAGQLHVTVKVLLHSYQNKER